MKDIKFLSNTHIQEQSFFSYLFIYFFNSMVSENFFSVIWDTYHWNFFGQIWTQDTFRRILGPFLVIFDICQFLVTVESFQ